MWCVTGVGPFRDHLKLIDKSSDSICRYCKINVEASTHLLYECKNCLENRLERNFTIEDLESKSTALIKKLIRDTGMY